MFHRWTNPLFSLINVKTFIKYVLIFERAMKENQFLSESSIKVLKFLNWIIQWRHCKKKTQVFNLLTSFDQFQNVKTISTLSELINCFWLLKVLQT